MPRTMPVRDAMTTDVLTFAPDDTVESAMRTLVERGIDAGPVVDGGTRFDPLGATPPDLPSYRWAAALRSPAYRLAQLLGRGRSRPA